jgi:hypothetical protein
MADKDREAELLARLAALEARLAEVEAKEAAAAARASEAEARLADRRPDPFSAMESLLMELLPSEAREHLRAARKERLLAVRSLVDAWIERADKEPPKRRRRESITLDGL